MNQKSSQGTRMIHEPRYDPTDVAKIESFRQVLLREDETKLPRKYLQHDPTLFRFLEFADFNETKAKDELLKYIKWREEYGVDEIVKNFKYEEAEQVKKNFPRGYHGVDKHGRPVFIQKFGKIDIKKLLQVAKSERFKKHHVYELEKTLSLRYPACSLAAGRPIHSTVGILDAKGVGIADLVKQEFRDLFTEIQKIDNNYVGMLHQLYIINAGLALQAALLGTKLSVDARTAKKIKVLNTDYKSTLLEVIDPSELPSFLGGKCTCSGPGGCMFSDKGPWNDPNIVAELKRAAAEEEKQLHSSNEKNTAASADNEKKPPIPTQKHGPKAAVEEEPSSKKMKRQDAKTEGAQKNDPRAMAMKMIQEVEPILKDANQKLEILEATFKDVKLAIEGVAQRIQDLKQGI